MSNVLIPLGGAGGKNRGTTAVLGDGTPFINSGSEMNLPLPAGIYKKSKSTPRADYGDGKNAEVTISVGLLRKMVLKVFGIASISNFSITPLDHRKLRLTWARPNGGLWNGVRLVFKQGSLPTSIEDGFILKDSADVYLDTEAMPDGMLFVRAFNYLTVSNGRWYDDGEISASIKVEEESGSITLSAGAGTWTVPDGVRRIRYILVGHGGNGGEGHTNQGGTGGGGGGYFTTGYMSVTPGQAISWIIPTLQGSSTVFGDIVSKSGENGNNTYYMGKGGVYGGDGGSGGGAGANGRHFTVSGGDGGVNGSDGGQSTVRRGEKIEVSSGYNRGGIGQHSSTIGFNGVHYSGGGCGGGSEKTTQEGGGGIAVTLNSAPRRYRTAPLNPDVYAKACGVNGLGGGAGGYTPDNYGSDLNYDESKYGAFLPSPGGTGCIYIAWGNLMND